MSYSVVAKMAEDIDLINRIAACASTVGVVKPVGWVSPRSWEFAAQEGWAAAYEGVEGERPGLDEDGVTDSMILAAVQAVLSSEAAAAAAEAASSPGAEGVE